MRNISFEHEESPSDYVVEERTKSYSDIGVWKARAVGAGPTDRCGNGGRRDRLSWNLLSSPGWPPTHRDPPASALASWD